MAKIEYILNSIKIKEEDRLPKIEQIMLDLANEVKETAIRNTMSKVRSLIEDVEI